MGGWDLLYLSAADKLATSGLAQVSQSIETNQRWGEQGLEWLSDKSL